MPVSRPARASSKKCFSVSTCSVTAEEAHENGGRIASEGVGKSGTGALDLPSARLAAELGDDLRDLGSAGGADGMALGLEAARGIHGDLAAETRPALLGGHPTRTWLEESQAFRGHDLRNGEAVVELHHVDVYGRLACLAIGSRGRALGGGDAAEIALLVHEHGVGGGLAGERPHRAGALARDLLGGEDEGGAPVGEGTAVEELEGIGDVRALEHGVDGDFLLELCLRIQDAVPVI